MSSRLALKRRLGQLRSIFPLGRTRDVILTYHAIGSGSWALATPDFRRQMDWLAEHTKVVSLPEILTSGCLKQDVVRVALSFDDGYASVFRWAAPILYEAKFPAVVYLNTAYVQDVERIDSDARCGHYPGESFLLWREIEQLRAQGWTIGSHCVAHVDLTSLGRQDALYQLRASKAAIEGKLGAACEHFCYPWGRNNGRVISAARATGYLTAVGTEHGAIRPGSNRHALPRIDVRREYELADFISVVRGEWDYLGAVQRVRRWFG